MRLVDNLARDFAANVCRTRPPFVSAIAQQYRADRSPTQRAAQRIYLRLVPDENGR